MSENEFKQGVTSRLSSTKSSVLFTSSTRSHGIVSNTAAATTNAVSTRATLTSTTNKTKEAVMIPNHKQTKSITPTPTPPISKTNTPTTFMPAAITATATTSSQYPSSTRMMHGSILNSSNRHPSTMTPSHSLRALTGGMTPSSSSASKYPWIPPEYNHFHRRKFVLSYCHTGDSDASGRQRPDECPQQLTALGAEIVPELTKDVFALVVDDEERCSENRRPRKSEEKSNQLIKNKNNRFMKAITSSSSSATPPTRSTSVSTVNSTPSSASQTSTSLSSTIAAAAATPVLDARRTLAQNLNIQVWTRSRLIKELQATFNSIQSPRTDLPPCSSPRLIIEDVDQKYRPSIKVFALINPLKSSSSRGSKNSLEYESTPLPTYGQLDENYHGHGSPFMFGHRLTSHNSTTHHHKATTPAPKKRTFCEICNEDFPDSEQEHFITPKHYQLYHDPAIWRESRLRAAEMRERDERARKAAEPMDVSRYAPVQQKCILALRQQLLASADEEVWDMVFRGDVQWEYFVEHAVEYGFEKELAQALQQLKEDADNKRPQSGTSEQNVALVETNTRDDAKLADDQPTPMEIDDENKEKRDESDADESSDSSDDDSGSDDDSENEDEQKESAPLSPIPIKLTPKSSNLKPSSGEPIETIDLTMDLLTPTSSPSQSHHSSTPRRSSRPLASRRSITLLSPLPPSAQNSVRAPKQDEVWMKFLDPTIPPNQPTESNETEAASTLDIVQLPDLNQQPPAPSTEPETDVVLSPANELFSDLTDQPVESNEVGGGGSPSLTVTARRRRPRKTADPSATSTAIGASSSNLAPSSPPLVVPASSRHRKNHKKGATPQHPDLSTISASAPILANHNSPQPGLTPSAIKKLKFEEEKERRVSPRKPVATNASASTKASEAAAAAAPMASSATSTDLSSPTRGNDRKKRHNQPTSADASKLNSGRSTRGGAAASLITSTSSPNQLTPNDPKRSGRSRNSVASADASSSQPSKVTLDTSLTTVEVDEPAVDVDAGAASTGLESPSHHGSGRTTRRSTRDEPATPSVCTSVTRSGRKAKKETDEDVNSNMMSSSPISAASPATSHQPTRPSTRSGSHQLLPTDSGITAAIVTSNTTSGPLLFEDESRTKPLSQSSIKKRLFDDPSEKRTSPRKSSTNSATIGVAAAAATTPTSVTSPPLVSPTSVTSPSHAPSSAAPISDSKKPRLRRNPLAEYNASGPGFPEATTIDLGSGRSTRKAAVALKSDPEAVLSTTTTDHTPQPSRTAVASNSSRKRKLADNSPTSVAAVPVNSSSSISIVALSRGSVMVSARELHGSELDAALETVARAPGAAPTSTTKSAKRGPMRKPGNMEAPTDNLSSPLTVATPSSPQQLLKRASTRSSGRGQVEEEPVAGSYAVAATSASSFELLSSALESHHLPHTPKVERLKMTPNELASTVAAAAATPTSLVSPPPASTPSSATSSAASVSGKQMRIPRDLAPYLHSGSSFPEAMSIDLDAGRLTRKATGAIKAETEPISSTNTTDQSRSTTKASTSGCKPKKDENLSVQPTYARVETIAAVPTNSSASVSIVTSTSGPVVVSATRKRRRSVPEAAEDGAPSSPNANLNEISSVPATPALTTTAPISPIKSSKRGGHKRKAVNVETSTADSSSSVTVDAPSTPQQQPKRASKRSSGHTQVEDDSIAVCNSSKATPSEISSTSNMKQMDEVKVPTTPARTTRLSKTQSGGTISIPTTPVAAAASSSSLHHPPHNTTPKSKRAKLESTRSGAGSSSAASAPSDTPTLPNELDHPEPSTKTAKKRTTNTTNRAIRELGSFFSSPLRQNQVPMDSVSSSRSATKQLIEQVSQQRKSTRTETTTSTKEDQTPTPTTTSKKKIARKNTKSPSTPNVDPADLASTTPTPVAPPATATSTTFSSMSDRPPVTPKQEPHDLTKSHTPTRSGRSRNSINSSENNASMIEPTASGRRSSQRHLQPDKSMMELKSNERIDSAGQLLLPVPVSHSSFSSPPPAFFTPRVEDAANTLTKKKKSHLTNKPIPRKLHLPSEFEVTDQAATNAPNETVPNNSGKKRGRPKKNNGANSTPRTDATLIIGAASVVTSGAHAAPSSTATHHLDSLSPDRKMQRELARLGTYLSDGHRQEHTIDLESILISTQMTQSTTLTTPTTRRTSTASSMLTSTVASQSKVKERTPKRKHMETPDAPSSTRARGINATTTTIMSQDEDIEMVPADEELPPPTTTNRRSNKKRKLLDETADESKENRKSDLSPSFHSSPSKHPKKYKPSALASLPSPSMVNNIPTSSLAPFLSPHIPVTPTTTMVVRTRLCTQVVRSSMKAPSDSPLTNALVTPGKLEQELVGNKKKNKKGLLFQPLLIDQSPTTITPTITDQHSSPPIRPSTAAAAAASSTSSSAGPSPSFGSPVPFPLLNSPPPSSSLPSNSFLSARALSISILRVCAEC